MADEHWYARQLSCAIEARIEKVGVHTQAAGGVIHEALDRKDLCLIKQAYRDTTHGGERIWVAEWLLETPHNTDVKYLLVEASGCQPTSYRCGTPQGDALIQYETGSYRLTIYCLR